jgi:hypothetical protein
MCRSAGDLCFNETAPVLGFNHETVFPAGEFRQVQRLGVESTLNSHKTMLRCDMDQVPGVLS